MVKKLGGGPFELFFSDKRENQGEMCDHFFLYRGLV